MPAIDIDSLARIARREARILSADLDHQLAWLIASFTANGGIRENNTEATQLGQEGSSSTFQYRGSTAEERRLALDRVITEVEAEIAARDAGQDKPIGGTMLRPRFFV
jgi:hypothetical protein